MKKMFLLLGLLASFTVASAQNDLGVGNLQLNAGFGLSSWGTPVYLGVDYGVAEDWTVGGEISYRSTNYGVADRNVKYTNVGVVGNVNYHFNRLFQLPSQFDLYAGGSLGYYSWTNNYKVEGFNHHYTSGFGFALQLGGRYFFTNNFGVNLELGGGTVSGGKLGITYKF
ncbi:MULTISPECIES: outer membrane beta-barrel protein [Capnocytophaga]|uniref:Outer membrane protein beta-barrel domain-containing protein n=1 Tax=Capnocytophaga canis TaxID=1848903 RepID=A0A0B7I9M2_9FLAO|nr:MULTISPECIES: outer membrane beta-barrel protein [Capnocytophaga]ATA71847.1 hypothetical protein CGC49_00060 [Capnocytophaga sp. H4358]ATA73973.1 hypothetical protein CGC52_00060 [Capnocytophaga sp. H2931]CEN42842.1 conserved exported hypothetical protein [Capnocytophaga canis]CEN47419.1 conserved exported hypothetical protein [Capnocytophaga canis]CEN50503.1 conserved exported hypothetical protein [Capnocytophaga canis]